MKQLSVGPLRVGEGMDAGAEEEIFRRMGQQAAAAALGRRWEQGEQAEAACRQCGGELKNLGRRKRKLQTVCGPVEIGRSVFYCSQCRQTQACLDRQLGVDTSGMTPGLMRLVCPTALELPYQQSEQLLADTLGFLPCSAREIERVAKSQGRQMEDWADKEMASIDGKGPTRLPKPVYVLAIDGTMIPGLPHPQQHRLDWHEVKLAPIFDSRAIEPSLYVAGREDAEHLGERLWRDMQLKALSGKNLCLIVADGAPWIWNLADRYFRGVPQLLDFYHAAEHLHATAEAVWGGAPAQRWWQQRLDQLRQGKIGNFFAALKWLARRHDTLDPDVSPKRLLQYFTDNHQRLDYSWARKANLPIGSGAVESAARHIVQQRLKQSGMRWSDPGAQAVLNLRTCHRNGDFEQFWENHAKCG